MRASEGENYFIDVDGGRAVAKVWRMPQLDSATGARLAGEIVDVLGKLVRERRITSLVFDVTDAPPVAGPKTTEMLSQLLTTCERGGVALEILVSNDAMQNLQFKRLVSENAPTHARVRVQIR